MTMIADTLNRRHDRRPWLKRLADASEPYLYSAPSLILIIAVMLAPLAVGISYAFRDIQLLNPFSGGFIGLEHFRALSKDAAFYGALRNTLWWTGASVILQFIFGLILALLLDKPFWGRGIVQALVLSALGGSVLPCGPQLGLAFQSGDRAHSALALRPRADRCAWQYSF